MNGHLCAAAPADLPALRTDGDVVAVVDIPRCGPAEFHDAVVARCRSGARLGALVPLAPAEVCAVLIDDCGGRIETLALRATEGRYPSLTVELASAQALERDLYEQHGIVPEGHPWLKPLRRHADLEHPDSGIGCDPHGFFRVEGAGIHEVAVGPVHAGIIEPGHFRFQCQGETVLSLEIQLGYQHRGVEALLRSAAPARRLAVAESVAGDTAVGHALAYCCAIESLAAVEAPPAAQALRSVALEIERIANHVGDLGALAGDIGYQPGATWFGRLRGECLNLLLELSGNRFGRGLCRPGGVRTLPSAARRDGVATRLDRAERDFERIANVTFAAPTVLSRFESTGVVSREVSEALGLVGPVARASGCTRDTRSAHPRGMYRFAYVPVTVLESGDVLARALVRRMEVPRSIAFARERLAALPETAAAVDLPALRPDCLAVGLVEGWRGEILHVAVTGADGRLVAYRVIDPSLRNWFGLAIAMRGNQISDFPLCNKSFNLSYAGHDL